MHTEIWQQFLLLVDNSFQFNKNCRLGKTVKHDICNADTSIILIINLNIGILKLELSNPDSLTFTCNH